MSLLLKLPNDATENINFSVLLSTRNLKIAIEKKTGIPFELQRVHFSDVPLDDNKSLEDQSVKNGSLIHVQVDMWWKKIVSLSLQGSTATLGRRVSVPMQQIGEGNRTFVTLLICATRGVPQGIASLLSLYKDFDFNTVTKVTGRSLFHAAVTSRSLKCVEELKKHVGLNFEKFLYVKDKSGLSPLDELSTYDTRMLHYINKFLSSPLTVEQVENRKNIEHTSRENTYDIEPNIEDIKEEDKDSGSESMTPSIELYTPQYKQLPVLKENMMPKLGRIKEDQKINTEVTKRNTDHTISSMASLLVEQTDTSKTIKVGEARIIQKNTRNHLPVIQQKKDTFVPAYSPRPVRRAPQMTSQLTPIQVARQPHPPSPSQQKKRPVAGLLMESNLRKFSAASHPRPPNSFLTPVAIKRPIGIDEERHLSPQAAKRNQEKHKTSPTSPQTTTSEEKVRRISLIRRPLSPRPITPIPQEEEQQIIHDGEQVVIEIERDRIEKPWNSWIKAVTVEADVATTTAELETDSVKSPVKSPELKIDEASLNVPGNNNGKSSPSGRKISFDQWVLYKAQEQQMQHQSTIQSKDENLPNSKLKHGKTFEQWQKETEARKKQELELKKKQEATVKETEEQKKTCRRKESSAKYEQWLLEKERIAFEKEMKELQQQTKRKVSSATNKNDENTRKT